LLEGTLHAVRHALGCENQVSSPGLDGAVSDDEPRLSTYNEIEFVGTRVGVHFLLLSRLETIQADQEARGAETVELGHFAGGEPRAQRELMQDILSVHG